MKIYNVFFMLWRAWLWISVMFGLIIFSPIALIVIHSYKTYWIFHLFCKYWCRFVLIINGFWYHLNMDSSIDAKKAYIICPNHTSKFDIILLFATFPSTFVFVGKKNVSNIKFFDWFYDKTMITFKRGDVLSSFRAYRKADKLLKRQISIVIFPEGRVPDSKIRLDEFKLGAFKLAISNQVPIIPLTFVDNKRKYPENNLQLSLGLFRVLIHEPINTVGMKSANGHELKNLTFNVIHQALINYENK